MTRESKVLAAALTAVLLGWLAIAFAIVFVMVMSPAPAWGHGDADWIRRGGYKDRQGVSCCGPNDCAVAHPDEVDDRPDGWQVSFQCGPRRHSTFVAKADAQQSEDGQMWRCVIGCRVRCLFLPRHSALWRGLEPGGYVGAGAIEKTNPRPL